MNLLSLTSLLAQASEPTTEFTTTTTTTQPEIPTAALVIGGLVYAAVILLMIISMWKIFTKAGRPGWASIIPIYNLYVMCKIANKSGWWVLLMCIPFLGVIFWILLAIALGEVFGKGTGFGVGLALLSPIFFPILGFGDARYQGPPALPAI